MRLLILLALALMVSCGGGGSRDEGIVVKGRGVERIDSAMRGVMNVYHPPGISVAVARNGRLVFARAYGSADLAGNEPLRPDHLFRVASVSKAITGVAALIAAERGLLDVQAKAFGILSDYLPASGADPRIDDVTVWHLMHHTDGWDLWESKDPLLRTKEVADDLGVALPPSPEDLVRWLAKQSLAYDPGTDFHYTNIGFIALGRVIEASTGFGYEDFVHQFVLEPAGITRARLGGMTRDDRLPDEVEYESFRDPVWRSVFDGITVVPEPAYGGINLYGFDASSAWVISAVDMARFGAATDGDNTYPDILTRESFEEMIRVGTPSGTTPVGVAWFLGTDGRGKEWNHAGGMPGTSSLLARLPNGAIIAVVTNTSRGGSFFDDLTGSLVTAVNGITQWPTTDLFQEYD